MKRKIVADSSLELNDALSEEIEVHFVPFYIDVGEKSYVDDGTVDQKEFLATMKAYPDAPKSAAPTPASYLEAYQGAEEVFVVTLSSQLSASYNNAMLAKEMAEEEGNVKVHVFDSLSAVCGETLVGKSIADAIRENLSFEEIVEKVEAKIASSHTLFVLESLENLVKNGRVSRWKGAIAGALSMMPVMRATEGEIHLYQMARGRKNAYQKLIAAIGEQGITAAQRILYVSHCNAKAVAEQLITSIEEQYDFLRIELTGMKVLSSLYANQGGIVISF